LECQTWTLIPTFQCNSTFSLMQEFCSPKGHKVTTYLPGNRDRVGRPVTGAAPPQNLTITHKYLRIKFRRIFALFANERKNLGLSLNLTKGLVVSSKVNVSRGWAAQEFGVADFGDKRLTSRLISLADRFSDSPESPINQACYGLAETKGNCSPI
jgi:hypothetical protein